MYRHVDVVLKRDRSVYTVCQWRIIFFSLVFAVNKFLADCPAIQPSKKINDCLQVPKLKLKTY